jgi:CheY-like chemotaxis protein
VVEDEAIVRKMSVRSLELYGFQVYAAASGPEALAILRTTPIDLVVSDIMMPQMTGRQLADRIRETWATIPILLVTGYSEEPVEGFALLPKPVTPAALAERVQSLLGMDTPRAAG